MNLIALMITKDDGTILREWCEDQPDLYDAVVCLDGSSADESERILRRRGDIVYLHERDYAIPYKTDHGLRRIAHQEIVRRFGTDNWVMCCHADEFCYHDPRKAAEHAEHEGFDQVSWFTLQFYPHPQDALTIAQVRDASVRQRFRHYHWSHRGSGLPWLEDRLYRNGPQVAWDQITHGSVRPHRLSRPANFPPVLCHYKVVTLDLQYYEPSRGSTFYRSHWYGLEHRTGLPFDVQRPEDLFVDRVPGYERCDRFDGTLPHAWNIGDQLRPDATCSDREVG